LSSTICGAGFLSSSSSLHLLQTRSELFNLFLQVLHFTVFFEELVQNLPNEFQSGISAGFELVARKP
jgi:hypothetical protein